MSKFGTHLANWRNEKQCQKTLHKLTMHLKKNGICLFAVLTESEDDIEPCNGISLKKHIRKNEEGFWLFAS